MGGSLEASSDVGIVGEAGIVPVAATAGSDGGSRSFACGDSDGSIGVVVEMLGWCQPGGGDTGDVGTLAVALRAGGRI